MVRQPLLAVLERPVQTGAVETSFADVLYAARELNRQFGGLDLVLRGAAVTAAVDAPRTGPLPLGLAGAAPVADPATGLTDLLADGAVVRADLAGLARLGLGPDRLLPGVRPFDGDRLAELLPAYEQVWFL
ncbi:hypothetical protein [Kitasatospora sp. P5_F3]